MSSKLASVLVSSVLLPLNAAAHPGHGEVGGAWTAAHYLTEPLHVAGALGILAVGSVAMAVLRRHLRRLATRPR